MSSVLDYAGRNTGASFLSMRELSAMPFDQLAGMVEQGAAVGLGGMAARLGAAGPRMGWDRAAGGVEQALPCAKGTSMLVLPPPSAPQASHLTSSGPAGTSAYGTAPLALPAPPSPAPPAPPPSALPAPPSPAPPSPPPSALPAGSQHHALAPALRHQQHGEPWWGLVDRTAAPQPAAAVGSSRPHTPSTTSLAASLRSNRTSTRSDAASSVATRSYRPVVGAPSARAVAPDRSYRPARTHPAPTSAFPAAAGVTGRVTPSYGGRHGAGQGQGAASHRRAVVRGRDGDLGGASISTWPHTQASRPTSTASGWSSTVAVASTPYSTAAGATAGGRLSQAHAK